MTGSPTQVAHAFVAAINAADLVTLRALMTEDHTFTDSRGNSISGADTMIPGWRHFFHAFPEYWIHVDHTFADGHRVALFGQAGGKWRVGDHILPGSWKVAAAWLAEAEAGQIRHWTVFCDTTWATPPSPAPTAEKP